MPKDARLRKSAEFRVVYGEGKRFEGRLITVFVLRTGLSEHRLGITASRKMSRLAVKRNRAKRLLREAFRLTGGELDALKSRYDWVFNARRSLLEVKVEAVIADLRRIVTQVERGEQVSP
ncbi:MAG TPA: ribonuclease P protein component [Pyrinomonadaceae bacterium]